MSRSSMILAVLLATWAFHLHGLAADSFWGDEILTATFASRPPAEVIQLTANDIHPPLYYLLVGRFVAWTVPPEQPPGVVSDWVWRFPSVLAGVLTVTIVYRFALDKFRSAPLAIAAAFLLGVAPVVVKYAQEARMHALFMLCSMLATWGFFRAMARPTRWSRWLWFALATTANLYTMYFAFLILAAQGCYIGLRLLLTRRTWTPLLGFGIASALAGLLYLPWWPVLLGQLAHRARIGAIEGGVGNPIEFIRGVVQALGPAPEPLAWVCLGLFGLGVVYLFRTDRPLAGFALAWLLLPVLLPIALGDPRALHFRYAFVLPVYLLVGAYGLWRMLEGRAVFVYAVWILVTLSWAATLTIYPQSKPNWREAGAYLAEHAAPGDVIVIGPLWDEGRFIGYYYRGEAQLLTPAAWLTNIETRTEAMRVHGGRIWAVNRFAPALPVFQNIELSGVVISEPTVAVYEPDLLTLAALDLARQAVEAAHPWAEAADAQGVLSPDPRTAQALALRALGDALRAADNPAEAAVAYQQAVDLYPGWVNGYVVLGQTYELLGNAKGAAQAYQQAIRFNSTWQGDLAAQATAYINAGQWDAALVIYHQIMDE